MRLCSQLTCHHKQSVSTDLDITSTDPDITSKDRLLANLGGEPVYSDAPASAAITRRNARSVCSLSQSSHVKHSKLSTLQPNMFRTIFALALLVVDAESMCSQGQASQPPCSCSKADGTGFCGPGVSPARYNRTGATPCPSTPNATCPFVPVADRKVFVCSV